MKPKSSRAMALILKMMKPVLSDTYNQNLEGEPAQSPCLTQVQNDHGALRGFVRRWAHASTNSDCLFFPPSLLLSGALRL